MWVWSYDDRTTRQVTLSPPSCPKREDEVRMSA
jgi:hypothetical protein